MLSDLKKKRKCLIRKFEKKMTYEIKSCKTRQEITLIMLMKFYLSLF